MLQADQVEELVCVISALDRAALAHQILEFRAAFPVDFTPEFLDSQSVERLRHLLFAMCVQAQHMPGLAAATA
ncbi:MAG: hypothetical protein JWO87_4007 [Phycisphaerales bacterium]|jgi:hypothetical protein|nr:hypothetical protein [Phycisphaerales bacterium]MDB5302344.1 hypothetical protein [Phycisphaerales bacterium]MDB5304886.1 hypothetical protein [Phycisphaerales bacterium]